MSRDARWPVYLQGSSRQKGSKGDPFGFLQGTELVGRVNLVLLPYNYPKLASLVQQAVERGSASGHLTSLPVKWRPEFNHFLAQTPPYYYPALRRALKRMGLHTQVPESKTGGLSLVVVKRLQRLRDQGREENQLYEASRNEHPHYEGKVGGGGGGEGEGGGEFEAAVEALGGLGGGVGGREGGQNQSLLSMWEGMRQRLFGEGGHVTSGLYVKGFKSWHGACGGKRRGRGREGGNKTLLAQVGALQVPQNPIMEMGAYTETLLKTETLRDPLTEFDPKEDTPEAWLQRKLAVDFGNPFRQQQQHHQPHHHHPQQCPQLLQQQHQHQHQHQREGKVALRVMLSAEAENEAAVLGPRSSLGEDLEGDEEGREGGMGLGMLLSEREGSGEGGGGGGGRGEEGNDNGDGEQPSRKRQRLIKLPPLPTARKLRRHQQLSTKLAAAVDTPPPVCITPLQAHPSSPPLTPMVGSVLPPALPGLDDYVGKQQEEDETEEDEEEEPGTWSGLENVQMEEVEEVEEVDEEGEERKEREEWEGKVVTPTPAAAHMGTGRGGSSASSRTTAAPVTTPALHPSPAPHHGAIRPASTPAPAPAATAAIATAATATASAVPKRTIEEMLEDKELTTPNADGWMLAWSKREKRLYYFNIKTNVAVWTSPPGLPPINADT